MYRIYIKHIFMLLVMTFLATSCNNNSLGDGEIIPDGLTILFPEGYVDEIAIIEAENHEDEDGNEESEDHNDEIAGFLFEEDGQESYIYRELNLSPEGSITIGLDETKEFSIHFLDEDGNEIEHEEGDQEHGLHIEITGISIGTTYFQIQLMHDGHSDFTSLGPPSYNGIPITVIE